MLSTLEVLYVARERLNDPNKEFDFHNWTSCTCGHIYAASKGRKLNRRLWEKVAVPRPKDPYADIIMDVARALGWKGRRIAYTSTKAEAAATYVSNATKRLTSGRVQRYHALKVIDRAIATIEARQQQDRLDVLAQMRAVVDAVPVDAEVPAGV